MLLVELSAPSGREDEWNRWYEQVHIPELLALVGGAVRSTRYRVIHGADEIEYVVMHEFDDQAALAAYLNSPRIEQRRREYDQLWGEPGAGRLRGLTPILEAVRGHPE